MTIQHFFSHLIWKREWHNIFGCLLFCLYHLNPSSQHWSTQVIHSKLPPSPTKLSSHREKWITVRELNLILSGLVLCQCLIPFNLIISVAKKSERIEQSRHTPSAAGVLKWCPLVVEVCMLLLWQKDHAVLYCDTLMHFVTKRQSLWLHSNKITGSLMMIQSCHYNVMAGVRIEYWGWGRDGYCILEGCHLESGCRQCRVMHWAVEVFAEPFHGVRWRSVKREG